MALSLTDMCPILKRPVAAPRLRGCLNLLILAMCADTAYGVNLLTATPSTLTLSCTTTGGPGAAATVVIKPVTPLVSPNTIVVTLGTLPTGIVAVTTPSSQVLSVANQAAGIIYTVNFSAGCAGAVAGTASPTFRPTAGGTADVTVTVNRSVTATASALVASPTSMTITCVKAGSVYTRGPAKTIAVTSAATGGTPFTVDTVTNPVASWLTVTPTSGGTAGVTGISFTVQAAAGCGAWARKGCAARRVSSLAMRSTGSTRSTTPASIAARGMPSNLASRGSCARVMPPAA